MDIRIERANIEDAKDLILVQNDAFLEDFKAYGECPSYNVIIDTMENYILKDFVYKIMDGNSIIGDIHIKENPDNKYYLRVICIIQNYQGLGIGQKAITFIENEFNNAQQWNLITPFKSIRNQHFYEKMGYTKIEQYRHSAVLIMFKYQKNVLQ